MILNSLTIYVRVTVIKHKEQSRALSKKRKKIEHFYCCNVIVCVCVPLGLSVLPPRKGSFWNPSRGSTLLAAKHVAKKGQNKQTKKH